MNSKMKIEVDSSIKVLELQFIELIRKRLGIVMHSHQNYELFKTIQDACTQFNLTPIEYFSELSNSQDQSPLLDHLISGITVGETYFFRDQQQMHLLQNELLPEIIRHKREDNTLSLRIWSAGCSTGEEIYSIGMMLNEILPDINKWTIKLLATDINPFVLQKAMTGNYTEWSMRSISEFFKKKYFSKEDSRYVLIKKIKDMVNFYYLNLSVDNYPSIFNGTNVQDLIIFRNVLIYIDAESCVGIMKRMNSSLIMGGYLMLGASDPVCIADTDFVFNNRKNSLLCRSTIDSKIEHKIEHKKNLQIQITKAAEIKKTIKTPIKEENRSLKAAELANLGKLEEAIKLCEEGFSLEPTNKLNYYTYGLAMSELNKLSEAESALRKTVFLDNQFVAGHFQLGLLLLRKNQHEAGIKSLKNALEIAESRQQKDSVPGSPGLCYKDFAEILRNEINLYMTVKT